MNNLAKNCSCLLITLVFVFSAGCSNDEPAGSGPGVIDNPSKDTDNRPNKDKKSDPPNTDDSNTEEKPDSNDGESIQIVASASTTEGNAPLEVNFTASVENSSEEAEYSFQWDFGVENTENDTSSKQNPSYTYRTPGTYEARVTVTKTGDGDSSEQTEIGSETVGPINVGSEDYIVELEANKEDIEPGEDVLFSCTLVPSEEGAEYKWFIDGERISASGQNLPHTFSEAGEYDIACEVNVPEVGAIRATKTVSVESKGRLEIRSISATPSSGTAPLTVSFKPNIDFEGSWNDLSYSWGFGDGETSSQFNPTHTYSNSGTFDATLTVSGPNVSAEKSKTIDVSQGFQVNAIVNESQTDSSPVPPRKVAFECSSSGGTGSVTYNWAFGDGGTDQITGQSNGNTTYTYESAQGGPFIATCEAVDGSGQTAVDVTKQIDVSDKDFTAIDVSLDQASSDGPGTIPRDVVLNCEATGGNEPITYQWTFGDGNSKQMTGRANGDTENTYQAADNSPYRATCEATDSNGDTISDFVDITLDSRAVGVVNVSVDSANTDNSFATPRTVALRCSANGGNPPFTYEWDFGDGATDSTADGEVEHDYTDASGSPYVPKCTVEDSTGDTHSSRLGTSVKVQPDTSPTIQQIQIYPADPRARAPGTEFSFVATVSDGNTGTNNPNLSYEWDFDGGNSSTAVEPSHTYSSSGTYTIKLTVTDSNGDTDTATKTLSL